MLKSADSETIRDLEDAVDIDVSRGNLGMSSAFRDSADRFQTATGAQQQMSGGRDGASRFVSQYSHDGTDNATRGGLVESYDGIADKLEKQIGVLTSLVMQQDRAHRKAIAELASYVLGVPLQKRKDDDSGEIADDEGYAATGDGAEEHETDESSASEERKDSSSRQRKARTRKAESEADDEAEESTTDESEQDSGIKSMTVRQLYGELLRGKLQPGADTRKSAPFQNPVRQAPNFSQSYGTSRRRIIKSRALIEAALAELPPEYAIQYETHLQRQAAMARGLIDERSLAQTQAAFDEVQRIAAAYAEE